MTLTLPQPSALPEADLLGLPSSSSAELSRAILKGFSLETLEKVRGALELDQKTLAPLIGLHERSLSRLKLDPNPLSSEVSNALYRLAQLLLHAERALGSRSAAREWLKRPNPGLGGVSPLEFARTEPGAFEVRNLLGSLEYGMYF